MKKILIICPHFPPSNLAAVHRSRLFAQHLPSFGWEPIILTVDEKYYEEKLDYNLSALLPVDLRVIKVKALPVTKPRFIGDIGLRAFGQLYSKAKKIIEKEIIDFLYIPIPSFYVALLGRLLHGATRVKYGIDYIDPWVHQFPGSNKLFSRHWFSTKLASVLEPFAIKHASLITGVSASYYKGVQERNPDMVKEIHFAAMPYGGEKLDHERLKEFNLQPHLFEKKSDKIQLVYAGAMLPKAFQPLETIFSVIKNNYNYFSNVEIHFIGTGKGPNHPEVYNIKPYAEKYSLWKQVVFEYPARIPYLDVLTHLSAADGAFILGSTEPHYTPSKIYQAVLSDKPILAVLHQDSSACNVIKATNTGVVLGFNGEAGLNKIKEKFLNCFVDYRKFLSEFDASRVDKEAFQIYGAKEVTGTLAEALSAV